MIKNSTPIKKLMNILAVSNVFTNSAQEVVCVCRGPGERRKKGGGGGRERGREGRRRVRAREREWGKVEGEREGKKVVCECPSW